MAKNSDHPGFETLVAQTRLGTLELMLVFAVLLPPILVVSQFIGAAITHFCLHLVGHANRPFETIFRVTCATVPILLRYSIYCRFSGRYWFFSGVD